MKPLFKQIFTASILAGLIILSSYFFKGKKVEFLADAIIYGAGTYFFFRYFKSPAKACSTKSDETA
jgi:hypothetical protein